MFSHYSNLQEHLTPGGSWDQLFSQELTTTYIYTGSVRVDLTLSQKVPNQSCLSVGELLGASSAGLLVNNLHRFGLKWSHKESSAAAVLELIEKAHKTSTSAPANVSHRDVGGS